MRACYIVRVLLADRGEWRDGFANGFGRVAVIADGEKLSSIPEYQFLPNKRDYDRATHGLGAIRAAPVSTARENNVLCSSNDNTDDDVMLKVC